MTKSRDAFRTISEVSETLDTPAHVLRFWESKFSQVKPVKRAGGRRYYRPTDVELLAGIKQLLHSDGLTIKGAQKLLRERGVKHVAAIGAAALSGADSPSLSAAQTSPVEADDPAAKVTPDIAPVETAEAPAPLSDIEPEIEPEPSSPSNVVPLAAEAADPEPANDDSPTPDAEETPAVAVAAALSVPDDPSDNDSKATARFFNHLQAATPARLRSKAEHIAPLLDRMQVLRDRIHVR